MKCKKTVTILLILAILMLVNGTASAVNDLPSVLDIACEPTDIIQLQDGSFLVTDAYYKVVLHLESGMTSLYAGMPTRTGLYGEPVGGYRDSQSDVSTFRKPWAIVPFCNGYAVADTNNSCIRYVTDQITRTIAGDAGVAADSLSTINWSRPTGLAVDETGDLYISDTGNNRICMIDHIYGQVTVVCEELNEPTGLSWNDGCLYIAETGASRILKWDAEQGILSVLAGNGEVDCTDGEALDASFAWPLGVEAADNGAVYVADSGNCAVRMIKDGIVTTLLIADMEALDQYPSHPQGMLFLDGVLYVCDPYANKVFTVEVGEE